MIEVKNIVKNYGFFEALKDVSFKVNTGEVLGFLGPNGAGKTTMMRILTGFFPPTSGVASIMGIDVEKNSLESQKRIGYLSENVPLYFELRVKDYLDFVAKVKGVSGGDVSTQVKDVIGKCGLESVQNRLIKKLSKGYKQRVGIAQALIGDPDVLILDEPTTGLDPKQIIEIRSLIKSLAEGNKTIILSTHILPEVSVLCDRVIIINEGQIVAEDTPQNLEKNLKSHQDIFIQYEGDLDAVINDLEAIPGFVSYQITNQHNGLHDFRIKASESEDIRPQIAKVLAVKGNLLEMRTERLSLEDIFVQLVTEEAGEVHHA